MVQNSTTSSWDDLRVVLVLAREGTVRSAARAVGVSHSTILRRLGELEASMGARLFERRSEGYELTAAGQDVFDTACELEDVVGALERRVEGRDTRLSGRVRITLPDLLLRPMLPIIGEVVRAYPDIEVIIASSSSYVDLAHRQADIAIRVADNPPPDLVGRRVCKLATGVYGSAAYLRGRSTKKLASLDWIMMEDESRFALGRWIAANVPDTKPHVRFTEPSSVCDAVSAGLGVTVVPCATGDADPSWKRVCLVPEIASHVWILTHRDLRTTARVRVLRDAFAEAVARRRPLFEGRGPQS